jgi:poly(3-hydroxybutyrate) depolymerase
LSLSLSRANLKGENFSAASSAPVALGAYRVDPAGVTVAGISSGGAMAVQLQIADSASFHGAAIFAGDPYYCNQDALSTWKAPCASGVGIPVATLTAYTNSMAAGGLIDPTSNIGGKPIYMFSGTRDTLVDQPVMDQLQSYYLNYTGSGNIVYNNTTAAQHAWITPDAANDCTKLGTPFMNNCGFDAEQTFLTMFYGKLAARNATAQGSYVQFNQDAFCSGNCAAISMDSTAWLYVPDNCAGQACKLVVALHGCGQGQSSLGNTFVQQAGINEWADNNNILVLYPQAIISTTPRNPEGCWDWWGYTGAGYALKSAPQMRAIMAMVNRITAGQVGQP